MAIQSDETLVTKGDLKTLYTNKILPYLGGNMMMTTNVSDYYSEDEKVVGIWIDGRPLYQKTFSCGTLPNASNKFINTNLANIKVLNIFGCSCRPSDKRVFPIIWARYTNGVVEAITTDITYSNGSTTTTNAYIQITTSIDRTAFTETYITLQYTKTTDAANSALTTPGCYDLNRPDLQPANKEVFFGNGLYGYKYVGTTGSSNTTFSVGSNIKKLISYGGYIASNTNNLVPIGSYWTSTNYVCAPYTTNANFILMYSTSGSSYANKQAEIQVTYTK